MNAIMQTTEWPCTMWICNDVHDVDRCRSRVNRMFKQYYPDNNINVFIFAHRSMLSLVFSSIRRSQHLFHFQFKHFHTPGRHFHFISSLVCLSVFNVVRLRFRGGFSRNNIRFPSRCTCSNSALRRPKVRKPRKSPQKNPYKSPHKTPESHHTITSNLRHPRKSPHKNPRRSPHRKSPPESKKKGSAHVY